jgi:cytoskeletal protein CcmA (bactofilin family)
MKSIAKPIVKHITGLCNCDLNAFCYSQQRREGVVLRGDFMSFFGGRRQVEQPTSPQRPELPSVTPPMPQTPVGFETVLGGNSVMEGVFKSTLEITGNVLVGETARITADINARNISIAGAVRGNVNGKKVQLLRTGRIWGDIRAQALTTEEGAFIDGKITMTGQEQPTQETPALIGAPMDVPPLVEDEPVTDEAIDTNTIVFAEDSIEAAPEPIPDDESQDEERP